MMRWPLTLATMLVSATVRGLRVGPEETLLESSMSLEQRVPNQTHCHRLDQRLQRWARVAAALVAENISPFGPPNLLNQIRVS